MHELFLRFLRVGVHLQMQFVPSVASLKIDEFDFLEKKRDSFVAVFLASRHYSADPFTCDFFFTFLHVLVLPINQHFMEKRKTIYDPAFNKNYLDLPLCI